MTKPLNAIVTGSTSGIGLGIAHALAGQGYNILFNGFGDKAEIDALVAETGKKFNVKVEYSNADMSKPDQIAAMVAQAEKAFGSVDVLVNNAGIQFTANIEDFPEEKWNAILAINLSAAFFAMKSVLPGMQKNKFGRIINIASAHGLVASAQKAAYVAAKHGIIGLGKVAALENAQKGITVNSICPGWVLTPLVQKQIDDNAKKNGTTPDVEKEKILEAKEPTMKFSTPEQIGGLVVYLCSDSASNMTGASLSHDGGWTVE